MCTSHKNPSHPQGRKGLSFAVPPCLAGNHRRPRLGEETSLSRAPCPLECNNGQTRTDLRSRRAVSAAPKTFSQPTPRRPSADGDCRGLAAGDPLLCRTGGEPRAVARGGPLPYRSPGPVHLLLLFIAAAICRGTPDPIQRGPLCLVGELYSTSAGCQVTRAPIAGLTDASR